MAKAPERPKRRKNIRELPHIGPGIYAILLGVILLTGFGIRLIGLDADPPFSLSWSQGPFTDGAVVVHDARNLAFQGNWIIDYCEDLYLFPLSNIATAAAFRIKGVGRSQAALPNTLFGMFSILALSLGIAFAVGRGKALFWALFATFNYYLIMFQRIPIAEPAMIFLVSLSFLFFSVSQRWRGALLLCGFFAMAAPLFGKAHAGYFPVVILATLFLTRRKEDGKWGGIPLAATGMAAAFIIWLLVLFIPHHDYIWSHVAHESYQKHDGGLFGMIHDLFQNALSMGVYTHFTGWTPILCFLAFVSMAGLLFDWKRALQRENPVVVCLILWVIAGWFFFSLIHLPAPRYLTILTFPLLFFAVRALERILEGKPIIWKMPRGRVPAFFGAVLLLFLFYQPLANFGPETLEVLRNSTWGIGLYNMFIQNGRYGEMVLFSLVESVILLILVLIFLSIRKPDKPFRIPLTPGRGRVVAGGMVILALAISLNHWGKWAFQRTYYLRDASRDITDWIGPGARIMGSYAPTLGLDNGLPVYPYFGGLGDEDVFHKYGITHVAVVSQGDHSTVHNDYPEIFEEWSMVLSYPLLCRYSDTIGLFRVPGEAGGRKVHDYKPSLFERAVDTAHEQKWEEALELLLLFSEEKPGNADGHYLTGFMYNELGRYEQAAQSIQKAISLREKRPYYHMKMGEIFAKVGRRAEAAHAMETAYRLNPRDTVVRDMLLKLSPNVEL